MAMANDHTVNEWVTVRTCVWGHEADLVRSVLEGSGIEVFIPDEYVGSMRSHVLLGVGGVRVQVQASDAERAMALLEEFEKNAADGADEETPD
jgi:hypothetical protein